jgi:hypothetical protein
LEYYVLATDGHNYGPVDEGGLKAWAADGRIAAHTVIREAGGRQRHAAEYPFLRPIVGGTAPPSAAPSVHGKVCPRCAGSSNAGAAFCEHCGHAFARSPGGRTLTGYGWLDTLLGFGLALAVATGVHALALTTGTYLGTWAVGYTCMVGVYVGLRPVWPGVARGWGAVLLALLLIGVGAVLLILGFIAICSQAKW